MATIERERYQAALAALRLAQQQARRSEQLYLIAVNRQRQADEEGFDEEAERRAVRATDMADALAVERDALDDQARLVETQRGRAVNEEIDELVDRYVGDLGALTSEVERLAAALSASAAALTQAATLALDLPPGTPVSPRLVRAKHVASQLTRLTDELLTALRPDLIAESSTSETSG